jgi:hypothetical protein
MNLDKLMIAWFCVIDDLLNTSRGLRFDFPRLKRGTDSTIRALIPYNPSIHKVHAIYLQGKRSYPANREKEEL